MQSKSVVTLQDAIKLVVDRTTSDFRFEFNQTRAQKWVFWTIVVCAGVGTFLGLLSVLLNSGSLALIAVKLFHAGSLQVLLYQFTVLAVELVKLKNPEKEIALPLAHSFGVGVELIRELAWTFDDHHLSYARAMFERSARQMRERIALLIGALDKVGLIPLGVTSYLSYMKLSEGAGGFGSLEFLGMAFIGLYLFAVRMLSAAQWMEAVSELYAHALTMRQSDATPSLRTMLISNR